MRFAGGGSPRILLERKNKATGRKRTEVQRNSFSHERGSRSGPKAHPLFVDFNAPTGERL